MTSFISRFLKHKSDEEAIEETATILSDGEDEGLFMATSIQGERPALETPAAEPSVPAEAPSSIGSDLGPEASVSDDAGPASSEEPAAAETMAPEPEEASSGPNTGEVVQASPPAPGGGDDALSMFRDAVVENENTDLTKELEDVPVGELLAELREIRKLLGIEAEAQAGEDG